MGMRVIVIGAGVIGSSLAFRLAQSGVSVTIVERAGSAHGTTGGSFSWINANAKRPHDYFTLNFSGMDAHRALRDELGDAPWLVEGGNLVWVTDDGAATELETRLAELREWNYPAEWIAREQMQELEPQVRIEPEIEQGVFFPDEAWIDGPLLAERMCALAVEHGATTRFACQVTAFERDAGGERIAGVRLAHGEVLSADLVVNCAGPFADRLAEMVGRSLPLAPTLGVTVRITSGSGQISRVVHAPRLHMRPDANGLVMLHHGDADDGVSRGEAPADWARELLQRAGEYVPGFAESRLSRWAVATRPIPADERTSAGLVPSIPGYTEVVTHSGITLGPLLARLVSAEITSGQRDPLLENFAPSRF
jgi:glycine/D-amino acid oxidase-like deaminating enzyme